MLEKRQASSRIRRSRNQSKRHVLQEPYPRKRRQATMSTNVHERQMVLSTGLGASS